MSFDFAALLSPDNAVRKSAESQFEQCRQAQPQLVATQLVAALSQPGGSPTSELCAVLARRYLPPLFALAEIHFSLEAREHVKAGLLASLGSASHPPSLRRKLCSLVGRLGAEFHAAGSWPQLSAFIAAACADGAAPEVHESALSVLSHMAPAIVEPAAWAACGQSVQATLVDGLGAARAPAVRQAALASLAALLRTSAAAEQEAERELRSPADDKARKAAKASRKAQKAIGQSLGEGLPAMLGALEGALQAGGTDATAALESLAEVAENQPRLFRPVLPQVVEGMASLAVSAQLPATQRIAALEVVVTLAETQPKLCLKVEGFAARMVSTLLSRMVTLGEDCGEWDEAEPPDGMADDDCAEDDLEAGYAAEALDRVVSALEGAGVAEALLPQLEALANGAAWQQRHAALVAVGMVCETCAASLLPHLAALLSLVASGASAPEPRVRWAACFALGLLSDEFEQLSAQHHATALPLLLRGIGDASRRVQAASALGVSNLASQMEREALEPYAQQLLAALHGLLAASPPHYVAFAAASTLSQLFDTLGDGVAPVYATFMPMLRSYFEGAIGAKAHRLAAALLSAIGSLAAAAGEEAFQPDAEATVAPLVELLLRQRPMLCESSLLEPLHACLARLAAPMGAPFGRYFAVVLPTLLEAAGVEPEVQTDVVEEQPADGEEEEHIDTHYVPNKGCGFLRVRVNSAQMEEKLMGVSALHEYADALGAGFAPFVPACVEAASSLLGYKFHPRVRTSSAFVMGDAVKALVAAAKAGEQGGEASAASLVGSVLKPLSEAVHREKELEPLDGMLSVLLDVLRLQRLEGCALLSPPQLNGLVALLKHALHLDARRTAARADAAAEEEEGEGAAPDEEELDEEWELLLTAVHTMRELLRLHGAAIVPTLEAQLLPAVGQWLAADENHQAASLYALADLVEFGGQDAAKRYTQLALPHIHAAVALEDGKQKRTAAAAHALGAVGKHGGKLLSRAATADAAARLAAVLQAPDARCAAMAERTEAAALALGKLLSHRHAHLEAAGTAAPLTPLWLSHLPLKNADEEDAQAALRCLCEVLERAGADKPDLPLGADLPLALGVLGAAAAKEATGAELASQMQRLLLGWQAAHPAALQASAAALPPPVQQGLARLVAA